MTQHEALALLTGLVLALDFIAGRYLWPSRRGLAAQLDDAYEDGRADERQLALAHVGRLEMEIDQLQRLLAAPGLHSQYEQLAPEALNLPGPPTDTFAEGAEQGHARAGEPHQPAGRRIVSLGETGDDLMLTRDWFKRRDWLASMGFELDDRGHAVLAA